MIAWAASRIERYTGIPQESAARFLTRSFVAAAAAGFVLIATAILAFEPIFFGQAEAEGLQVGRIIQQDVYAPETISFVSNVLTEQRRQQIINDVRPIFDPPDPAVARQQTEQARRILDFVANVRADLYSVEEQKIRDIQQITALNLNEATIVQLFNVDDSLWQEIDTEIIAILERVMRGEIKSTDLARIRAQLPTQVSVRFNDMREIDVIVSLVSDLLRPNTIENIQATEQAQQEALGSINEEIRSFEAGQLIITSGTRISEADYEVLERIGLLRVEERQAQAISRALVAATMTMVVMGMYIARFRPSLMYHEPRFLALLAALFLMMLAGARFGLTGPIYVYPAAALGLLYVAIIGAEVAIIGIVGLAFLMGMMAGGLLEVAAFVGVGGIIGVLNLRHPERLNSFFIAGLMVSLSGVAIVMLFNFNTPNLPLFVLYAALNGILTAVIAIAALYLLTLMFNLPTALKLIELSQPNQPLLQRLLREAPGSYQHSLQVSNLSEQAANAIGADAELTRVAALYHDIGKMLNPVFFTENQTEGSNPHDTLNDPYRSADIIIGHITGGDDLARQYRLPQRIRDFIREHHGTSQVFVFYQQAIILAGDDESAVDIQDFTYPGPRPRSRETAIMLLADGCEAAVRARQPKNKADIEEVVHSVIDGRRKAGQLDDSGLTFGDLSKIEEIFVDILQAIYHPRINYGEAISRVRQQVQNSDSKPTKPNKPSSTPKPEAILTDGSASSKIKPDATRQTGEMTPPKMPPVKLSTGQMPTVTMPAVRADADADAAPLAEVPRLRKNDDKNDKADETPATDDKSEST